MGRDDDIAAALPKTPPPNPARREAAIEAALRRFDGSEDAAVPRASQGGSKPWWPRLSRPQLATAMTAALVLLIGGPVAWMSLRDFSEPGRETVSTPMRKPMAQMDAAAPASDPASAESDAAATQVEAPSASQAPLAESRPAECKSEVCVDRPAEPAPVVMRAASPPPAAPPAPPPSLPPSAMTAAEESRAAPELSAGATFAQRSRSMRDDRMREANKVAADSASELIVSAQKRSEAARAPEPDVSNIVVTGARRAVRGDWNACTVNDPARSLKGCRSLIDPNAKGDNGRAAAHLADGLSRAWNGDYSGAIAAFDQAIAIRPRSSIAYLNRGLALSRNGQSARALADLDMAVKLAPGSARTYYNRSLVLRARGETRKARADEERAVEIDEHYTQVVQ